METRNIKIIDLKLWDENARFPDKYFNNDEIKLIEYFWNNKRFKIEELTKEIVKDFDLPQLEKLVIYNNSEDNITLEWNRRLMIYKLLNNPSLTENKAIKKFFTDMKKVVEIDDNFSLECIVSDNQVECYRYIKRKHIKWNNEVARWEQERTHHNIRSGNASEKEKFKAEIAKIVKALDIPEMFKEQVLWKGYVTNFWRILDSSVARDEFWFKLKSDGKLEITDKDFDNKLKVLILHVLQKKDFSGNKIDSRSLNTNKEKETYLKSITIEDIKKVNNEIKKNTTSNLFWENNVSVKQIKGKTKINPKSTSRRYLIPKTCYLTISENKINNIYRELRDNLLLDDSNNAVPNAVAVLFRVFLEISIDCFWEKNNWKTFIRDTKLDGKITKVSEFMEKNGLAKKNQLTNIRSVATSKDSILAIENFHRYVHSYKTQPSSSDLKLKRDNLEEFFEILWKSLESKKKK